MTDVRFALFGPQADAWLGALSQRVQENMAEPDQANLWVVNAEEAPKEVPDGCHVVAFALGVEYESDLPNLWETVETPERWMPAMYASLAEGRSIVDALKVGGPTPIRLNGKDPGLKKIITPRSKPAYPQGRPGAAKAAPAKKAPAKKAAADKPAAKKAAAEKPAAKKATAKKATKKK